MILAPLLKQRHLDSNGNPLAGGKLYSYIAGTTTPQATYTDQGGGTPNANPVILDADGYAAVWMDPSLAYKFVLTNSSDVTQWTVDGVTDPNSAEIPEWNANQTYEEGSIVRDSSGAGLLYVSLADSNAGNVLTSVGHWRMFDGNVRTITSSGSAAVTDNLVRSNSTSGNVTVTLPACSTTPIGKKITVKDVGTGGNTTSVRGNGSDVVDSAVTYPVALGLYDAITVMNTGSKWDVLGVVPVDDSTVELGSTGLRVKDAGITQAKLASRATGTTVAAGGVAVSAACSSFSATSATFADVTNLSVTITTLGRPVMLMLVPDASISTGTIQGNVSTSAASASFKLSYVRDSTALGAVTWSVSGASCIMPITGYHYLDVVAAGTYTYKVQARGDGTNGATINNVKLIAFEL